MDNRSSASPNVGRQEIDRVLRLKRKQRESKACYPCRQRKVKCDNGQPCRTCQKRGHPEICAYDVGKESPRHQPYHRGQAGSTALGQQDQDIDVATPVGRSLPTPNTRRNTTQPGPPESLPPSSPFGSPHVPNQVSHDSSTGYVFSGDNSVVSILRQQDPDGSMAREAGSVLGLRNTYVSYPFIDLKTPQDRWNALLDIIPHRSEVLKFFHFYRISAYPFNPILVDIDRFESEICAYLGSYASGELRDSNKIPDRWSSGKSVSQISLLLATLAAGAHFSDLENPQRSEICQDFARRSFQALRIANFLFRPSLDTIQSLLILGNTLQNNGQSDAAWALLGTTVRLAQTLGLHTEKSISHWPECLKSRAKSLWSMTVWQDSLLSLCYDRPPIVSTRGWAVDVTFSTHLDLSYTDVMHYLCQLGLDITRIHEPGESELQRSLESLAALDSTYSRAQPHLLRREHCTNLQQHLENLALRLHVSFCVSVLCRPAIKSSSMVVGDSRSAHLRSRAKESLISASRAFLDFQALSIVPLRSWSMVHTVLSSTLLLCIWQETRNDPECRELQQKVIEVFSVADSAGKDTTSSSEYSQWLSARHIRALVTLRNAVRSTPIPRATEREVHSQPSGLGMGVSSQQIPNGEVEQEQMGLAGFPVSNDFLSGMGYGFPGVSDGEGVDFSPVTYLDSIMNVPLFGFPDDNWGESYT